MITFISGIGGVSLTLCIAMARVNAAWSAVGFAVLSAVLFVVAGAMEKDACGD